MSLAGRQRRKSLRLICEINVAAFAGIMLALFAMFALPQMWPFLQPQLGGSVDLPQVPHPRDLHEANRTDAILIAVMRTGDVFLGTNKVAPTQLPFGIRDRVKQGAENKVYISADARAKFGRVREVLEAVKLSGTEHIAFVVWKRDRPYPEP
jgi:biopolymer transport protein ExbD